MTMRNSTAAASPSTAGSAPQTSSSPGVLAGQDRLLRPAGRPAKIVGGGSVHDRVQPAAELADRLTVERRRDRPDEHVMRDLIDDVSRYSQRDAARHVCLMAVHEKGERAAGRGQIARIASRAPVGDQIVVAQMAKFIVGTVSKAHGALMPNGQSRRISAEADGP